MPSITTAPMSGTARPVTPVSILADRLARMSLRLDTADGIDTELITELHELVALAGGLDRYISNCTTPESAVLRQLAERTAAEDWDQRSSGAVALEQEMLSGHVEGQALKFLVHLTRATRVLEIGMFTGYSALAMAEALPADGRLVACELDRRAAAIAEAAFAGSTVGNKIEVRLGPAIDTLAALAHDGAAFDLIFIDADKAGYAGYLDCLLSRDLLAPHGVVCVDNTLLQGQPWVPATATENGTAIAAFNQTVVEDVRVEQVLLPLRDGLTLIRRVG